MLSEHPHRRLNILTNEWVLVSPHRTQRPWQGQIETESAFVEAEYDENCYLCPRNTRTNGDLNPDYPETFCFDNDFATLYPKVSAESYDENSLLVAESERGICRVVCFSPKHNLTLARMNQSEILSVIELLVQQSIELGGIDFINSVQIFENRGEMMGCSNPHPHGQIWASQTIPNELSKELRAFKNYKEKQNSCLLCDYLKIELKRGERIVFENENFAVLVPFWAIYPFETMVLPKRHLSGFDELNSNERFDLGDALQRITVRYDNIFETSFPYSMGFHQKPTNSKDNSLFHFHAHFYPPLLRSSTVKKFLVGFELLATPQRDITPESAAERLRCLSEQHYLER